MLFRSGLADRPTIPACWVSLVKSLEIRWPITGKFVMLTPRLSERQQTSNPPRSRLTVADASRIRVRCETHGPRPVKSHRARYILLIAQLSSGHKQSRRVTNRDYLRPLHGGNRAPRCSPKRQRGKMLHRGRGKMTSCFEARIFNPGERFGKPFYEVDVPRPHRSLHSKCFDASSLADASGYMCGRE